MWIWQGLLEGERWVMVGEEEKLEYDYPRRFSWEWLILHLKTYRIPFPLFLD